MAACDEARDAHAADVVVFPELALTGYPPEDLLFRLHFMEHVQVAIGRLCRQISGITAIVGCPLQEEGQLFNAALVIRDGRIVAQYKKQLLPNYSVFDEKRYFAPGDQPGIVPLGGIPVGITICAASSP